MQMCQIIIPPTTFQQRRDNLWRKPKTNNFCRNSGDDCIIWDIFGDNGTGSDNCSIADFYTAAKFYVTADPNIIAESYRFYLFKICRGGGGGGELNLLIKKNYKKKILKKKKEKRKKFVD